MDYVLRGPLCKHAAALLHVVIGDPGFSYRFPVEHAPAEPQPQRALVKAPTTRQFCQMLEEKKRSKKFEARAKSADRLEIEVQRLRLILASIEALLENARARGGNGPGLGSVEALLDAAGAKAR